MGMFIIESDRRRVCVMYSRVVRDALSIHLGFFCRIDNISHVVVWTAEGRAANIRELTRLEKIKPRKDLRE